MSRVLFRPSIVTFGESVTNWEAIYSSPGIRVSFPPSTMESVRLGDSLSFRRGKDLDRKRNDLPGMAHASMAAAVSVGRVLFVFARENKMDNARASK